MNTFKYDASGNVIHRPECRFNSGVLCNEYGTVKCRKNCSFNPFNKDCHTRKPEYISPEESISEDIGYEIGNWRDIYGITPQKLADRTVPAVTRDRILDIESGNGDPIRISEFVAICNALDVAADKLLKRGEFGVHKKT